MTTPGSTLHSRIAASPTLPAPTACFGSRRFTALTALLASLAAPAAGIAAKAAPLPAVTYVVGATAALPAGATRVAQLTQVPWSTLGPGSQVIVSPGTYLGSIPITSRGTAASPITVRPSNRASLPVLTQALDFDGAAWVQVSGFLVRDTPYAAVVIRRGSHHITLQDSTLLRGQMGVDISDGAGTGHQILRNRIDSSVTHGIGVDSVPSSAEDRTRIADNVVINSGHHGMEIKGSYYTIEGNTVSGSGRTMGGTSGIHLYSVQESDGAGDSNIIRYNYTYGNRDRSLSDGNGIQADRWCDHNTIAFNVSWANDGAGIILFDAADNDVYANTTLGNALDPGGTHGDRAEIILNSTGPNVNHNRDNRVYDNIVVGTRPGVPAIHIDYTSKDNDQQVGPNLFQQRAGAALMRWGNDFLYTASQLDQFTGRAYNLAEAPAFVNESQPLQDGLRLLRAPSKRGKKISDEADMLGALPDTKTYFHGAYYTAPDSR